MSLPRPITFTPNVKPSISPDVVTTLIKMKDRVCGYIVKQGFNPPDDIFQEVAIAVLLKANTIENAEAYIFRVASNCVKKAVREKYDRIDKPSTTPETDLVSCEAYIVEQEHREREQRNWKELLKAQTQGIIDDRLPEKQKQVMNRVLLGMSYEKIAAELQLTEPNVRQLKSRAIRKIRSIMSTPILIVNPNKSIHL